MHPRSAVLFLVAESVLIGTAGTQGSQALFTINSMSENTALHEAFTGHVSAPLWIFFFFNLQGGYTRLYFLIMFDHIIYHHHSPAPVLLVV